MNRALKKRTETALDELSRTYELVRELLIQRLGDVDTTTMRKRGSDYASRWASRLDDIDTTKLQRRGYKAAGGPRKQGERRGGRGPERRPSGSTRCPGSSPSSISPRVRRLPSRPATTTRSRAGKRRLESAAEGLA